VDADEALARVAEDQARRRRADDLLAWARHARDRPHAHDSDTIEYMVIALTRVEAQDLIGELLVRIIEED
jgi:hypothetical protein